MSVLDTPHSETPHCVFAFEAAPSASTAFPVLRDTVLHPATTFDQLPLGGSWKPAVVLALVLGCLMWAEEVYSLSASLESLMAIPQVQEVLRTPKGQEMLASMGLGPDRSPWFQMWLFGLPTVPVGFLLSVVSMHLSLWMVGAAGARWPETARVVGYSSCGAALVMIPLVGTLASLVVVSIQLVSGLARVHRTSGARTILALSLPLIFAGVFLVLALAFIVLRR